MSGVNGVSFYPNANHPKYNFDSSETIDAVDNIEGAPNEALKTAETILSAAAYAVLWPFTIAGCGWTTRRKLDEPRQADAAVADAYIPDAYVPDAEAGIPDAGDAYIPDVYIPDAGDGGADGGVCDNPPADFNILSPMAGAINVTTRPNIEWLESVDPDIGDTVTYRVIVDDESNFNLPHVLDAPGLTGLSYRIPALNALAFGTTYYVKVEASDTCPTITETDPISFTTRPSAIMTVSFGKDMTYDWSNTYWATKTNLVAAGVNTSTSIAEDGWVMLSEIAPTNTETWDNLTAWTENSQDSCDSQIDPAGQSDQYAADGTENDYTQLYNNSFGGDDASWTITHTMNFDSLSHDSANGGGFINLFSDGTRASYGHIGSNGTNFQVYMYDGAYQTPVDTGIAVDTNWHKITWRCNNADDETELLIDGRVIASNLNNYASVANPSRLDLRAQWISGDPSTVQHHIETTVYHTTPTAFQTSDGILASNTSNPVFDAGLGNEWVRAIWTADVSNGTNLRLQAKTAGTVADLSIAPWFDLTNNTPFSETNQKRFILINATFQDDGTGRYIPILKDFTLTNAEDE